MPTVPERLVRNVHLESLVAFATGEGWSVTYSPRAALVLEKPGRTDIYAGVRVDMAQRGLDSGKGEAAEQSASDVGRDDG